MTALEFSVLALLVTATMAAVDYAHARYVLAMDRVRVVDARGLPWWRRPVHAAAGWSVLQWAAAAVGFIVSVRVTMWLLPFEAIGLYLGTVLAGRREGWMR